VVHNQLSLPSKQPSERDITIGTGESVCFVHFDHGQATALCGDAIVHVGEGFFFG
jgi:hypothetical protein